MSVLDNTKFILTVCEMYYKQGLSQKEISAKLNISRPQICRIIAAANERNLITIKFNYPKVEEFDYEDAIRRKFGVEAVVCDLDEFSPEYKLKNFAKMCSEYLSIIIKDGYRVGVMTSSTLRAVAENMPSGKYRGLQFVPLCGGYAVSGTDWYSSAVAQCFASHMNGRFYVFNAPQFVLNPETKKVLYEEPSIRQVLDLIPTCDISLVGIGNLEALSTGIVATSMSGKDIEELKDLNVKANICSNFLDADGKNVETKLADRILGAKLDDLGHSRRIAVAYGEEKTEAIISVLKSGYIDVLMTSLDTAKKIID